MADTDSSPVGKEQNVMEDGVFIMSTVGAMNTNIRNTVVTEMSHVPIDNYVYLVTKLLCVLLHSKFICKQHQRIHIK